MGGRYGLPGPVSYSALAPAGPCSDKGSVTKIRAGILADDTCSFRDQKTDTFRWLRRLELPVPSAMEAARRIRRVRFCMHFCMAVDSVMQLNFTALGAHLELRRASSRTVARTNLRMIAPHTCLMLGEGSERISANPAEGRLGELQVPSGGNSTRGQQARRIGKKGTAALAEGP